MTTPKKVCVLDAQIMRKGAKNILRLRSDILHKAFAANGQKMVAHNKFTVTGPGIEKTGAELKVFALPSAMSFAIGTVNNQHETAQSTYKGLMDYGINYDNGNMNMSPLFIVGLEQGVELTFEGVLTEEMANRWIDVAKAWASRVYNTFLRGWVVGVTVTATVVTEPEADEAQPVSSTPTPALV